MEDYLNVNEENISLIATTINDLEETDVINRIMPFFEKVESALLIEIKQFNELDSLLFTGKYNKNREKNFGFFKNVNHAEGKKIFYPILGSPINEIFVAPNTLLDGRTYSFEVKVARKQKRETQGNPFLLEARIENIEEIIKLSEIQKEIVKTERKLKNIIKESENAETDLEQRQSRITNQIEKLLTEKENEAKVIVEQYNQAVADKFDEANEIIQQYNQTIEAKFEEIKEKEKVVLELNSLITDVQTQLSEITNKKSEMESTINFLRQKIDTCKNLEFMTEQDGNRYLDMLGTTPFEIGDKYLDFEKDLSASFPKLVYHIQNYLYHKKNLIYTEFQIKNFMSLLMTNDLIVLSGLSGSGKTQIVKSFAEVLGGVAKIIPVKPNWTSSDDLLGYYNPIQSSFLPTPFTEAIAEAIQNPNRIYLICLDEMNLARVEYYFADFLSKMEERSEQPEIELYAKHEEELFISEFKTFLTLIESATGEKIVSSWQEFLETDSIRNRFFELLGNTEKETLLQIHSKMKRRLLGILKFPATIKIPNNVRFIGAINVDETTHYFSPKILDRVHIVKFENPLLIEDMVIQYMERSKYDIDLKPVYVKPDFLGKRQELPTLSSNEFITKNLKELNKDFLLPMSIDFGVRSMRQSINYAMQFIEVSDLGTGGDEEYYMEHYYLNEVAALNAIINQKILPRFVFDGNEKLNTDKTKIARLEELVLNIKIRISEINRYNRDHYRAGHLSSDYLQKMITNAEFNSNLINFYA